MPKKITAGLRARAVRMVLEHREDYPSRTAAAQAVARQLGVGRETVRRWVVDAEIDAGQRPGVTSAEQAEIKALKARVRRLEEDNAILKAATTFFVSMPSWVAPGGVRSFLRCLAVGWLVPDVRPCRAPRPGGAWLDRSLPW